MKWSLSSSHPRKSNQNLIFSLVCSTHAHIQTWIECRVNVKPNATNRCIRITIYPKCYSDSMPNFVLDINGANIDCGPVKSRSKVNVFGVLWRDEQNEKCRMFIAFDNKGMHQNFSKYFKELLTLLYSIDGGAAAATAAANTENGK